MTSEFRLGHGKESWLLVYSNPLTLTLTLTITLTLTLTLTPRTHLDQQLGGQHGRGAFPGHRHRWAAGLHRDLRPADQTAHLAVKRHLLANRGLTSDVCRFCLDNDNCRT